MKSKLDSAQTTSGIFSFGCPHFKALGFGRYGSLKFLNDCETIEDREKMTKGQIQE